MQRVQEKLSAAWRNLKQKRASWRYPSPVPEKVTHRSEKTTLSVKPTSREEIPSLGMGYAASHQGKTVGHTVVAGHNISYVVSECTCGGENPNCFKCDGTGFCLVERIGNEVTLPIKKKKNRTKSVKTPALSEASFSSDSRGGSYSIREQGRFTSNPEHDDYGDESTS